MDQDSGVVRPKVQGQIRPFRVLVDRMRGGATGGSSSLGWSQDRQVGVEQAGTCIERPWLVSSLEAVGLRAFWKLQKRSRNSELKPVDGECLLQGLRKQALPTQNAPSILQNERFPLHLYLVGKV